MKIFGWWKATGREQAEALEAGRTAMHALGARIWFELDDTERNFDESLILTPEEFHALRLYVLASKPTATLDIVYRTVKGKEEYIVKPGWDIGEIFEV